MDYVYTMSKCRIENIGNRRVSQYPLQYTSIPRRDLGDLLTGKFVYFAQHRGRGINRCVGGYFHIRQGCAGSVSTQILPAMVDAMVRVFILLEREN
jgi:hypothetical protein